MGFADPCPGLARRVGVGGQVLARMAQADIPHIVLDQNMSVLEGSLGVLPRRVLVHQRSLAAARGLLADAGLGHELNPDAG